MKAYPGSMSSVQKACLYFSVPIRTVTTQVLLFKFFFVDLFYLLFTVIVKSKNGINFELNKLLILDSFWYYGTQLIPFY